MESYKGNYTLKVDSSCEDNGFVCYCERNCPFFRKGEKYLTSGGKVIQKGTCIKYNRVFLECCTAIKRG